MTGNQTHRKIVAILAADVVGYSRLAGSDEDRTLARLRTLRSDLIDPTISVHNGRVVKRTGDGALVEFSSVVDAVRCAIEVQNGMVERNAGLSPDRRIEFRMGIHLGDVVEESDGDLMGDSVNIAARLEGVAKPGAICLSEDAYRQVKARLDLVVSDLGEQSLKNIAEPIRAYSLEVRRPVQTKVATASAPPRLSIVVLPFANIGGNPEQEYFVDGVTESLTTDLSRISGSFVIGRNTAFTYKGKHVDLKQIGRELNVRYVLEGSVQHGGKRLRVNVQLIDAETGNHLWAERFDKPVADLFDMQDEIVSRLANTLNIQMIEAEAHRVEYEPNPDSMDLYFKGAAWINKGSSPENVAQAMDCFERALTLDPRNIEALVGKATVDTQRGAYFMADDRAERLAAATATLTKVLSLAPNHPMAHLLLGHVLICSNRAVEGIVQCEQALALDRNLAFAHGLIGGAKYFSGSADETEGHVNEALRLSPRDTKIALWLTWVGNAKAQLSNDSEAVVWLRRALDANRNFAAAHFFLAASLALIDQLDDARAAARAGLELDPTFTISRFRAGISSKNSNYLAGRERMYEGMRAAGVPE
ncbi:adenylate/guanylate cyclase domain-containing protein [Bradyrhizobium sp.]|uniref:adenylate/guanylate cyclase domain-containing protein n=1 Tax=Bradyrhizobium sp. TaxID=376 RepID=UPI002624D59F|nr:adenylate/guanylate cyclase domain-containing protein [Bradyrhizobium sp.]